MASSSGFLIEMRLQAQNTHISEAVKKILQKKHARVPGRVVNVRAERFHRDDAPPRRRVDRDFTAETPSAPRKSPPMSWPSVEGGLFLQKPSFTNVIPGLSC